MLPSLPLRGISPTGGELKTHRPTMRRLHDAFPKRGCPPVRVFRASPGTLPASPLFIRVPEVPTRSAFIHAGFGSACPQTPYPLGRQRDAIIPLHSGSALPKDKVASRRQYEEYGKASQRNILAKEDAISEERGVAWREEGLDCLSVSELSSPPPSNPRQGVFCASGSRFFADFLWRDKERR